MAMFCYNPQKPEEKNVGGNKGWMAKVENEKLIVWENDWPDKRYYVDDVDGFEDFSGFVKKGEKNIWCSFNPDMNDFHIVPDKDAVGGDDESGYIKTCNKLFDEIKKSGKNITFMGRGGGNQQQTVCHRFNYGNIGNYQYLISFNRLWCDANRHIHNNFGQMQFMRYRIKCDNGKEFADRYQNINWGVGPEFRMMYPSFDEDRDGQFDPDSGHLSYNAPFELKQIVSDGKIDWDSECTKKWISEVAKAFDEFIALGKIMDKERKMPCQT